MKRFFFLYTTLIISFGFLAIPHAHAASPQARAMARSLMAAPSPGLRAKRFSLGTIKRRHNLRRHLRGIDIDSINFRFASAEIDSSQYWKLDDIAAALRIILRRGRREVFLVEGHTDAVGSFAANQRLSERRARSVVRLLTRRYGIPRRAMTAAGYGERHLKIRVSHAERRNRRVTVRRVTDILYRPVVTPKYRTYKRNRRVTLPPH